MRKNTYICVYVYTYMVRRANYHASEYICVYVRMYMYVVKTTYALQMYVSLSLSSCVRVSICTHVYACQILHRRST